MKSYQELLQYIVDWGDSHNDRTGVGTYSVFGYDWGHDMRLGFPLLTTKKVPMRWVFEELMWFLSGSTNEKDLRDRGVDIWKEWATDEQCAKFGRAEGDLGPVYGFLWRRWDYYSYVDQIARLINQIRYDPNSRRLIVSGWNAAQCDQVALPSCHTLWQLKCYPDSGLMSLRLDARSIDAFLGLPFNIASYGLLLSMLAWVTGYQPRELIIHFGDLHLYKNHLIQAGMQIDREPRPLPRLHLPGDKRDGGLEALLSFEWKDISLEGYHPHPKIEAEVAV